MPKYKPCFYRPPQVDRWSTCTRKRRFETKDDATRYDGSKRSYRCPYCKKWHLTNKGKKKKDHELHSMQLQQPIQKHRIGSGQRLPVDAAGTDNQTIEQSLPRQGLLDSHLDSKEN